MTNSVSQTVKNAGLPSLEYLSAVSGVKVHTLRNWYKNRRWVFDACLFRAQALLAGGSIEEVYQTEGIKGLCRLISMPANNSAELSEYFAVRQDLFKEVMQGMPDWVKGEAE